MPMSQKQKLLIGFTGALVAALILGAYAFLGVFVPDQEEAERREAEEKLFAISIEALEELEIHAKGEVTTLQRQEGSWRLITPVAAPADQSAVDSLLERLERSKRKKLLEEEGDPSLFGLDEPALRISGRTKDGEEALLLVGNQNTFDSSFFASTRPNEIITIDGWLKGSLEKGSFDLRDKKVIDFTIDSLDRLEVDGLGSWALRRGEGHWLRDDEEEADPAEVDSLLRALRDLKATAIHDEVEASFGLDQPLLQATLELREGEVLHLRISRAGETHYAQVDDGFVAEVPATIVDKLAQPPPVHEPPEEPEPESHDAVGHLEPVAQEEEAAGDE